MGELFGHTRNVVSSRYALLTPSGFVLSTLPGWQNTECVVLISPGLGAGFTQFLITLNGNGRGNGETGEDEIFAFVLAGEITAAVGETNKAPSTVETGALASLQAGAYLYIPPRHSYSLTCSSENSRLLIFQKTYRPLPGTTAPHLVIGSEREVAGQPFMGNPDALLQVLLPDSIPFDMAVNIFTYQPGATLPIVETHVMEHGLLMLKGQGVYRLDKDWHLVREGDVIWMAPYCPQWFVAIGPTPASYIYYKDVNRERVGR
ncbi:MAG TPA: (S)-ureidoglycine aminohydrolase [Acidobacteriota bacterium]|nr:(S)-ureidoglycine aminohydrolase [Acidobacteriota bacterium]